MRMGSSGTDSEVGASPVCRGVEERDRPRQRKGWALRVHHGKECSKNPE